MEKTILSSKDNEKIKLLKKLETKKYRKKLNKFLVENLAIVYDALKNGHTPISLFVTEDILQSSSAKVKFILENVDQRNVFLISAEVNKYFSQLKTASGVGAVYERVASREIAWNEKILYLNAISNPGNLGTILRSAVAFGVTEIVLDEECADLYSSKTIQSAKEAVFKLNITFDKERNILKKINEKMDVLVTDVSDGEDVIVAFKNRKNFCVVMGSESHGVSEDIKKISTKTVNIKSDSAMESLNVAVSTGIVLYEIYKSK